MLNSEERFVKQIQYIIEQLNSDKNTIEDNNDNEDDDVDDLEDQEDIDENIEEEIENNNEYIREVNGEQLLNDFIIKDY